MEPIVAATTLPVEALDVAFLTAAPATVVQAFLMVAQVPTTALRVQEPVQRQCSLQRQPVRIQSS